MRRLTHRRQVKKRSKHNINNKYNKTRGRKYIKKRRNVTRRRALRGGTKRPRSREIDLSYENRERRFKDLVDALEKDPYTLNQGYSLQTDYKNMIELKDGYIGLTGLKFINYLWERINELDEDKDKDEYENLQTAVSLMDQDAIALGITGDQLSTIHSITKDKDVNYYCCYLKLFNELARKLRIVRRGIPLSTSACHIPYNSIDIKSDGVDPECKLKDYKRIRSDN